MIGCAPLPATDSKPVRCARAVALPLVIAAVGAVERVTLDEAVTIIQWKAQELAQCAGLVATVAEAVATATYAMLPATAKSMVYSLAADSSNNNNACI